VEGDNIELLFNVVGAGTRSMSARRVGDGLDILGPLGTPFGTGTEFRTAIIVGGGLGVAPLPFLLNELRAHGKVVETILGARTAGQLVRRHLEQAIVATDDGSEGWKGTVVDLLEDRLHRHIPERPKIFACGPTPMLKALGAMAIRRGIECELSLEGDMACGIGICQGCPVETVGGKRKYALVCTDGPTFHAQDVVL
jgi:dihydroorotate dehydrogenase electron transfer subunit